MAAEPDQGSGADQGVRPTWFDGQAAVAAPDSRAAATLEDAAGRAEGGASEAAEYAALILTTRSGPNASTRSMNAATGSRASCKRETASGKPGAPTASAALSTAPSEM